MHISRAMPRSATSGSAVPSEDERVRLPAPRRRRSGQAVAGRAVVARSPHGRGVRRQDLGTIARHGSWAVR